MSVRILSRIGGCLAAAALAATGLVLLVTPAANAAGPSSATVTFSGHCKFAGPETQIGATDEGLPGYQLTGSGTCVGSLNGGPSATYPITGSFTSEIVSGLPTSAAEAFLYFPAGVTIRTGVTAVGNVVDLWTNSSNALPAGNAIGLVSSVLGGNASLSFTTLSPLVGTNSNQ